MSAQDLIDPSFRLSSIFPNLAFDGLNISSGSQFGFCNKFLFKNNTFVFGDFSIKMTDYSFEQVHLSLDSGANNKREIQVEHGKIKIHLLTTLEKLGIVSHESITSQHRRAGQRGSWGLACHPT